MEKQIIRIEFGEIGGSFKVVRGGRYILNVEGTAEKKTIDLNEVEGFDGASEANYSLYFEGGICRTPHND